MKQVKDFYKTAKWKRKRIKVLRRADYKCQEAKRFGKYEEATTVHHIYPIENYPGLAYADWNLLGVSGKRHDTLHDRATGRVTEKGMYWQKKRRREFEEYTGQPPPYLNSEK